MTALDKYLHPSSFDLDPFEYYRFGTLVDAIITEAEKVNYFNRTVEGEELPYTQEAFEKATEMKKAFRKDPFCSHILPLASFQKIFIESVNLQYCGLPFSLMMRCKYDLWMNALSWGGDIKSTAAKTQKQFEEACRYFDYDRQRAVYMTLSGAKRDVLIGIYKENFKVFKITIERGDAFYNAGMEKFTDLAFKYWLLFENFNIKT